MHVCPRHQRPIGKDPVPSHLGVNSRQLRHPKKPSTTKNSSSSRARKTGAQLRDNRKSAKNDAKSVKKAHHRCHCKVEYLSLLQTGMSTISAMNRIWGASTVTMITGTSTTVDELHGVIDQGHLLLHAKGEQQPVQEKTNYNCGISTVSHDFARICWSCATRTSNT